jgi:hypothetical protein
MVEYSRESDAMSRIAFETASAKIESSVLSQSKIDNLLMQNNINKKKGISSVAVLCLLFTAVFARKNLFRNS